MVLAGETVADPAAGWVPLIPEIVIDTAFVDVQVRVELPPVGIVVGEAVRVTFSCGVTVTVTEAVTDPPGPVAVAV